MHSDFSFATQTCYNADFYPFLCVNVLKQHFSVLLTAWVHAYTESIPKDFLKHVNEFQTDISLIIEESNQTRTENKALKEKVRSLEGELQQNKKQTSHNAQSMCTNSNLSSHCIIELKPSTFSRNDLSLFKHPPNYESRNISANN